MKTIELTQNEINQALYCLESMQSDYQDETSQDYQDFSSLLEKLSMENLTKYEQFQKWLNSCPVELTDYQDFTDLFQITFKVPLEETQDN